MANDNTDVSTSDYWSSTNQSLTDLFGNMNTQSTGSVAASTESNVALQSLVNDTSSYGSTQDRLRALAAASSERDKSSASNIENFSSNLWVSNANDKLATADVYQAPKQSILSKAGKKSTSLTDTIADKLDLRKISDAGKSAPDGGFISDLKSAFSSAQKYFKSASSTISEIRATSGKYINGVQTGINKAKKAYDAVQKVKRSATSRTGIMGRIGGVNRSLGSAASALGMPLDGDTTRMLNDINKMTVTVGKVEKVVSTVNGGKASSIAKGIEALTGTSGLMRTLDTGARLAAGIGLVNSAAYARLPGVASHIISSLGPGYANKVAAGSLNNISKSANLAALKDLNSAVAAGVLKKINPKVLLLFAKSYMYDGAYTVPKKKEQYKEVVETFGLIDPNWDKGSINGEETLDLTIIMASSSQFKDLISVGSLNTTAGDKLYGFGTIYRKTDVMTELKKNFPRTVITSNIVKRRNH